MNTKENILAIPSKDRLRDESLQLLADAGLQLAISGRQLSAEAFLPEAGNFTLAFLRPKDIITLVGSGQIAAGIVGLDILEEAQLIPPSLESWKIQGAKALLKLGIGRCRLAAAVPAYTGIRSIQDLDWAVEDWGALTIATSYPKITERYFEDFGRRTERVVITRFLAGSVEAAPELGVANIITDLVETGTTLNDNLLREIGTIFESQAVLIASKDKDKSIQFVDAINNRLSMTLSAGTF